MRDHSGEHLLITRSSSEKKVNSPQKLRHFLERQLLNRQNLPLRTNEPGGRSLCAQAILEPLTSTFQAFKTPSHRYHFKRSRPLTIFKASDSWDDNLISPTIVLLTTISRYQNSHFLFPSKMP